MKRIGIVTTWFERGAAYVSKQFKEVWEQDNLVYVYARGGEDVALNDPRWATENITYGKRYSHTNLDLINLTHFKKWIKENDLDIVFFNEQHIWDPILLCKEIGVLTGSYIDYYTKETVPLFSVFDFLICNTERHLSVFKWHSQVFYIPWGTNRDLFNKSQTKITDKNKITFFHSAGMNPYRKGTDFLIRAFNQLSAKNAKLIIHSQIDVFSFFPKLAKISKKLIDDNRLEIVNKTVTAPGLYHKGDVYVYPTRLEGIGLSIAEANSCGLPVITTNEAPMNEFIKNNKNGHLINVSARKERKDKYFWHESYVDVDHLTFLLENYANNISDLDNRKFNALVYSEANFDWNKNAEKLKFISNNLKKTDKDSQIIKKIKAYEKSRGIKFYISNLVIYGKIKKILKK